MRLVLLFFRCALYTSLVVFVAGILWRVLSWFRVRVGPESRAFTVVGRVASGLMGLFRALWGRRLLRSLRILVWQVLLQGRMIREQKARWFAHLLIFLGFVSLLLLHALDDLIASTLFADYASTRNPFLFVRDLSGAALVLGLLLVIIRRLRGVYPGLSNRPSDWLAIAVLLLLSLSGFVLAGARILSSSAFEGMVADYAPMLEPDEVSALEQVWARDYGVVFVAPSAPFDPGRLERGWELHAENCAGCHSSPRTAFVSYGVSRLLAPWAGLMERHGLAVWLWTIHFLVAFAGLAYLPFGKMLHAVSSPVSLLAGGGAQRSREPTAGVVSRRALALDACTRCGVCSQHCAVAPLWKTIGNASLLPSEKLLAVAGLARRGNQTAGDLEMISEGSYLCTLCHRCTQVCPVGIDLQDLWVASRADLAGRGFPEPHLWILEEGAAVWADRVKARTRESGVERSIPSRGLLADRTESYSACVQCQMCTNVCPVVASAQTAGKDVDLTPQQIMNLLRLGLKELSLGSAMVWNCVTCYLCQEHCPEGIPVADIFYELRNLAYQEFHASRLAGTQSGGSQEELDASRHEGEGR